MKYKFIAEKRVCEDIIVEAENFDKAVEEALRKVVSTGCQYFYEASLFDDDNNAILDFSTSNHDGWEDAGYTGHYLDEDYQGYQEEICNDERPISSKY